MKCQSDEGHVVLTNVMTGEQVTVPNGTKVTVLDDMGDMRRHATDNLRSRDDWPCMYEGQAYFVDKNLLVRK